jgi:hypothetical protein
MSIMSDSVINFQPKGELVLIKLDTKEQSYLARGVGGNDGPTVFPSGEVLAIGTLVDQVAEGEHVAIDLHGNLHRLPLSPNEDDIYVTCNQDVVLGSLEGATPDSEWFKTPDVHTSLVN